MMKVKCSVVSKLVEIKSKEETRWIGEAWNKACRTVDLGNGGFIRSKNCRGGRD